LFYLLCWAFAANNRLSLAVSDYKEEEKGKEREPEMFLAYIHLFNPLLSCAVFLVVLAF
jgi:hypothetical protein